MEDYYVVWRINITATSFEDAAKQALEVQRDPDSIATVFEVIDKTGIAKVIDLCPR